MKKIILLTLLIIAGLGNVPGFSQELRGPEEIPPGTLAVFEMTPPQETSWCLFTGDGRKAELLVDTASHRIYFASPEPGVFTVVAATVADGKPLLYHKTFRNGKGENQPAPAPKPTPDPPDSLETWIKTNLPVLVKSTNLAKERELIANCFEQTAAKIGATIKTPQNAQTQIRLVIVSSLAKSSRTAVDDWQLFLEQLGEQLTNELDTKINDLNEIKRFFNIIANAIREPKPMALSPENCPTCRPSTPFRFLQAL